MDKLKILSRNQERQLRVEQLSMILKVKEDMQKIIDRDYAEKALSKESLRIAK